MCACHVAHGLSKDRTGKSVLQVHCVQPTDTQIARRQGFREQGQHAADHELALRAAAGGGAAVDGGRGPDVDDGGNGVRDGEPAADERELLPGHRRLLPGARLPRRRHARGDERPHRRRRQQVRERHVRERRRRRRLLARVHGAGPRRDGRLRAHDERQDRRDVRDRERHHSQHHLEERRHHLRRPHLISLDPPHYIQSIILVERHEMCVVP